MMSLTNINKVRVTQLNKTLTQTIHKISTLDQRMYQINEDRTFTKTVYTVVHNIFIDAFTDISILHDALGNYLDQVQDRVMAITSLNHHLLTPSLVSPTQLEKALKGIEPHLLLTHWIIFILCHQQSIWLMMTIFMLKLTFLLQYFLLIIMFMKST